MKWELEDLSLRALEPDAYRRIAAALDERRVDRQRYIDQAIAEIKRELSVAGVKAEVTGRPKHITSIWNKMRRKRVGIDALYDIRAVRVLVDDVKDCYTALGVVHNLWTPLPQEFDDYIAKPKANRYRSLHTAVIGPDGKPLEVQIRTHDMHRHSEYGVASHWRYKEGGGAQRDPGYDEKIAWLRQVLDWKDAVADAGEWLQQFKSTLFTDTIYVLTPQGKVVDLPRGATPVDFAYAVHTSLGHRCRGARVDGAMVPLNYALQNGQRIEIIAAKQGGPSLDWLNADLGYVQSHRARAKVRQWFKAQQLEATIAQGREMVERELHRAGKTALKLDAVAAQAGFDKLDEFFAAVSRAELNTRALQHAIQVVAKPGEAAAPAPGDEAVLLRASKSAGAGSGILIVGVDRLLTGLARCCKAGAARSDRRLRHPRQGHIDPPPQLQQRRAHAGKTSGAADHRGVGHAARRGVSGRRRRRGDGPAGLAARRQRSLFAREDQRHRGQDPDPQPAGQDVFHARGEEPRAAEARARASSRTSPACFRPPRAAKRPRRLVPVAGWGSPARRPIEHLFDAGRSYKTLLFNELESIACAYRGDPKCRFEPAASPTPYCYCAVHKPCAARDRPLREAKEQ